MNPTAEEIRKRISEAYAYVDRQNYAASKGITQDRRSVDCFVLSEHFLEGIRLGLLLGAFISEEQRSDCRFRDGTTVCGDAIRAEAEKIGGQK